MVRTAVGLGGAVGCASDTVGDTVGCARGASATPPPAGTVGDSGEAIWLNGGSNEALLLDRGELQVPYGHPARVVAGGEVAVIARSVVAGGEVAVLIGHVRFNGHLGSGVVVESEFSELVNG